MFHKGCIFKVKRVKFTLMQFLYTNVCHVATYTKSIVFSC